MKSRSSFSLISETFTRIGEAFFSYLLLPALLSTPPHRDTWHFDSYHKPWIWGEGSAKIWKATPPWPLWKTFPLTRCMASNANSSTNHKNGKPCLGWERVFGYFTRLESMLFNKAERPVTSTSSVIPIPPWAGFPPPPQELIFFSKQLSQWPSPLWPRPQLTAQQMVPLNQRRWSPVWGRAGRQRILILKDSQPRAAKGGWGGSVLLFLLFLRGTKMTSCKYAQERLWRNGLKCVFVCHVKMSTEARAASLYP